MNMKRSREQFAASYLEDFAYKSKMKHSTSMVYDAILYHCKIISQSDEYRARQTKYVSQEKIAKMIGKSQRTVSKAINALKQIESGMNHKQSPIPLLQVKKNQTGNATYTIITSLKNVPNTSCTESKNDVFQQDVFLLPTRTHECKYEQEHMSASIYKQNNKQNNKTITKEKKNKFQFLLDDETTPDF
jgi:hypothetical protein